MNRMDRAWNKYRTVFICLLLIVATAVAFERLRFNDFVYDDALYITANPNVRGGITHQSVVWAFTSGYASNWHPLTWLSHMLDCQLFGLNPLWHHLSNLLLHIANTLLLFWILKKATGAFWPSGFVAAAFALHPLHVESVAWVAERKDVLSGLFWMLTIGCYLRYVEKPSAGRYLPVIFIFCLGLMAKPMLVTLPFVLLLLDYWPLQRIQFTKPGRKQATLRRLVLEKLPLFALSAVSSVVTYTVQHSGGAVVQADRLPVGIRISNVVVSYLGYIFKTVFPVRLAILYPYPVGGFTLWRIVASFAILAAVTAAVVYMAGRGRMKYLLVGWLWYLGTLVPVIGLVQVGVQSMADRYTYLPSIGLFIMIAFGAGRVFGKWRYGIVSLAILAGLALAAMLTVTRLQTGHWKDRFSLYGHALEVTENNHIIHNNYANVLLKGGNVEQAVRHIRRALSINPDYTQARRQLAYALTLQGNFDQALGEYQKILRADPDDYKALNGLGVAFVRQGRLAEAAAYFTKALKIKPDYAEARKNLNYVLTRRPGTVGENK